MATIQIRDIPEQTYEVIRRRARAEGKSIQSYMKDLVDELASRPTKAEAVRALERAMEEFGGPGSDPDAIAADIAADRR